jgi:glycosyltransferase involved in cell wall biosynthesis
VDVLRRAALAGDFFICASERQRDYWLGLLDVCGRTNAHTYLADPTLRTLIDVVPFGLRADELPRASAPAIKGVVPGIAREDRVILWGGGLWEWLDPLTLIRAVARIEAQHPDVRLVFFSARHPNPAVPDMPMLPSL